MDRAGERPISGELDPRQVADFRAYLEQLLALPIFASRRRGQLLRYLVEQKLAGTADQVTEYGIGLDVFERPPSFDPRTEATVRAEMSRLRRTLLDHYQGAGAADLWRIVMPARGYVPSLMARDQPPPEAAASESSAAPPRAGGVPKYWTALWVAVGIAVVAAVALVSHYWHPGRVSIDSVAILPFANLTGDPHNDYLSDGVTEQLTDALAQIPSLRVVARTSAFQFKGKNLDIRDIGKRLNAEAVVEGSLQYSNGRLRLTVQVNRSGDGYHILSRSLEGGMQDLGRLENEMVSPLVQVLRPGTAVSKRRTPDPQAYDLYLKAQTLRAKGTRDAFDQAVTYLNQAIEHDPEYADAYAALSHVYAAASVNLAGEPLEFAKEAKAYAALALRMDPANSRAEASQGMVDALILLDWDKGEKELRRAVELAPQTAINHNSLGLVLLSRGRFEEAIAEQKTTERLDPLVPAIGSALAYYIARQYDTALDRLIKVRDLNPQLIAIRPFLGAAYEAKGQYDKAMAEYRLALPTMPGEAEPRIAILLAKMGKRDEARKLALELQHPKNGDPPNAFDIACVYATIGDRDIAFQWLDRAYERRVIWFLKVHPAMDSLRSDRRYTELLKKTGLAN